MILYLTLVQRSIPVVHPTRRREEATERGYAFRGAKVSMSGATEQQQFTALMRLFHWLTATLVLTMLGIGLAMVASLADYHRLVSIHRPLGILILIVVVIRFVNRHYSTLPPFPDTMSPRERSVASASELFLYALLVVQPLVGWGMLSAARYPITLCGSIHLFPILPHYVMLYAVLRRAHTILAPFCFTRGSCEMEPSAVWRRGGFVRTSDLNPTVQLMVGLPEGGSYFPKSRRERSHWRSGRFA